MSESFGGEGKEERERERRRKGRENMKWGMETVNTHHLGSVEPSIHSIFGRTFPPSLSSLMSFFLSLFLLSCLSFSLSFFSHVFLSHCLSLPSSYVSFLVLDFLSSSELLREEGSRIPEFHPSSLLLLQARLVTRFEQEREREKERERKREREREREKERERKRER